MKRTFALLINIWKTDYQLKTVFTSSLSTLADICFAAFNAVLCVVYKSAWHGSISVYYTLLALIRGVILMNKREDMRVFRLTHALLLLLDICLIAPVAYMVTGGRGYTYGLIPAIAMAAYTTYRISMAIFHFRKSRGNQSIPVRELRAINLQDALVAVLSLQNALIIACGDTMDSMLGLTACTSGGIWLIIVWITVRSLMKNAF